MIDHQWTAKTLFLSITAALLPVLPPGDLLMVSLFASILGASAASPSKSKFRDVTVFTAVLFTSAYAGAKFGHLLNDDWGRFAVTMSMGLMFHPVFNALSKQAPAIVQWLLAKVGVAKEQ